MSYSPLGYLTVNSAPSNEVESCNLFWLVSLSTLPSNIPIESGYLNTVNLRI